MRCSRNLYLCETSIFGIPPQLMMNSLRNYLTTILEFSHALVGKGAGLGAGVGLGLGAGLGAGGIYMVSVQEFQSCAHSQPAEENLSGVWNFSQVSLSFSVVQKVVQQALSVFAHVSACAHSSCCFRHPHM